MVAQKSPVRIGSKPLVTLPPERQTDALIKTGSSIKGNANAMLWDKGRHQNNYSIKPVVGAFPGLAEYLLDNLFIISDTAIDT